MGILKAFSHRLFGPIPAVHARGPTSLGKLGKMHRLRLPCFDPLKTSDSRARVMTPPLLRRPVPMATGVSAPLLLSTARPNASPDSRSPAYPLFPPTPPPHLSSHPPSPQPYPSPPAHPPPLYLFYYTPRPLIPSTFPTILYPRPSCPPCHAAVPPPHPPPTRIPLKTAFPLLAPPKGPHFTQDPPDFHTQHSAWYQPPAPPTLFYQDPLSHLSPAVILISPPAPPLLSPTSPPKPNKPPPFRTCSSPGDPPNEAFRLSIHRPPPSPPPPLPPLTPSVRTLYKTHKKDSRAICYPFPDMCRDIPLVCSKPVTSCQDRIVWKPLARGLIPSSVRSFP